MKGDFTRHRFEKKKNFAGVLHQQGKVLLDRDWNEQVDLAVEWQISAGKDVVGPGVAAIPASEYYNFRIQEDSIRIEEQHIEFELSPGRIWADGNLLYLGETDGPIYATSLNPVAPETGSAEHYAILLEIWHDVVSGFQETDLLEPALGGPDTTERLQTAFRFRFQRISTPDATCSDVRDIIDESLAALRGTLTVEPSETDGGDDDCPMEAWSGYTGLEHRLYRIEIADVDPNPDPDADDTWFKWSRSNGSIVGRGTFYRGENKIVITGNRKAILDSRISSFYIEIVEYDANRIHWRPSFGAMAVLNADNNIEIGDIHLGAGRPVEVDAPDVFFRIWDGFRRVDEFELPDPILLEAGICLRFDRSDDRVLRAGDFWAFPLRSTAMIEEKEGEVTLDFGPLPEDQEPDGIAYSLVPFAVISGAAPYVVLDCRVPFPSLAKQPRCTSYVIGGEDAEYGPPITEAIEALRVNGGGEIRLMPGRHRFNLEIDFNNVRIIGCGERTEVLPLEDSNPIFDVNDAQNVTISDMKLVHSQNVAISVTGADTKRILVSDNSFYATGISDEMTDQLTSTLEDANVPDDIMDAVYAILQAANISDQAKLNIIQCLSTAGISDDTIDEVTDVLTPHKIPNAIYIRAADVVVKGNEIHGGIQVAGGSEKVQISDNHITEASGNGITIGNELDKEMIDAALDGTEEDLIEVVAEIQAFLTDIRIERNEISLTRRSGIGSASFFTTSEDVDQKTTLLESDPIRAFYHHGNKVESLIIRQNYIHHCLTDFNEMSDLLDEPVLADELKERFVGLGGISILSASSLLIRDNIIENNGVWPVCGVFVKYGEGVEISDNAIKNDANVISALKGAESSSLLDYTCGGIVIKFGITELPSDSSSSTLETLLSIGNRQAARIHDNVVFQHYGHALLILACGPLAIVNNIFRTALSSIPDKTVTYEELRLMVSGGAGMGLLRILAGSVLVLNLGGLLNLLRSRAMTSAEETTLDTDLAFLAELEKGPDLGVLFDGSVVFNDNQISLGGGLTVFSQILLTLDDLECVGNYSDATGIGFIIESILGFVGNALYLGLTSLRASNNRYKEIVATSYGQILISLLTISLIMNITSMNQADHCIIPYSTASLSDPEFLFQEGNQMLDCQMEFGFLLAVFGGQAYAYR